ncbi:MAG: LysE family transporter [Puia sp.]|nr:LysE family transporter [Puia sp.]
MSTRIHLFFLAFGISFLGTLPIGTLNVSVANLVIHMDTAGAVQFALGTILVEVALVRATVVILKRLEKMKRLFKFFNAVACVVLFLLAGIGLRAAFQIQKPEAVMPLTGRRPFIAGLLLSILNPLHLPFWMGWTAVLKSKKVLPESAGSYNLYVTAIGTGTSLAFLCYGLAGHLLIDVLKERQVVINVLVSLTLLMTGLVSLYKKFIMNHRTRRSIR